MRTAPRAAERRNRITAAATLIMSLASSESPSKRYTANKSPRSFTRASAHRREAQRIAAASMTAKWCRALAEIAAVLPPARRLTDLREAASRRRRGVGE